MCSKLVTTAVVVTRPVHDVINIEIICSQYTIINLE